MITNLNGMFDRNQTKNQRQLVLCLKEKVEDCIEYEKDKYNYISGWHLKNTTTIKVTETKMWLKRSESKLSYEKIVSQKEPILANAGKGCYSNYNSPCFKHNNSIRGMTVNHAMNI